MKKNTFFKSDYTRRGIISHLRFIISDPDPDGDVLVVNMTEYHGIPGEDTSCLLYKGEHSECKKKVSYIAYKYAESMNLTILYNARFKGLVIFKDQISDEILKRIQEGAIKSPYLAEDLHKYFIYF